MAPLLRPSECSVLIVDTLNSQDGEFTIIANRDRVLEAASVCGIPSFVALYLHDAAAGEPASPSDSPRSYDRIAIKPEETHGCGHHAGALILALVEDLTGNRGHHGVHLRGGLGAQMVGGEHDPQSALHRAGRIGEEGGNAGEGLLVF